MICSFLFHFEIRWYLVAFGYLKQLDLEISLLKTYFNIKKMIPFASTIFLIIQSKKKISNAWGILDVVKQGSRSMSQFEGV